MSQASTCIDQSTMPTGNGGPFLVMYICTPTSREITPNYDPASAESPDLRVEDELFSGAAAVANARNAVVIDSGAGPGDGGSRGEPKEGGSLVEVMQ
jgi:hypothetical protein